MTYSEFRYWSIQHDRMMVRLSMCDAHGAEFFALIPASEGKSYRERREEALNDIEYAIEMGCRPGMVVRQAA